jgi:D-glycero-alpha-D-manno-heptose-7-phosphate kinase
VIETWAPVRICDNGGWTDTWFGGPGRVLNVAVSPGVEVTVAATAATDAVILDVRAFGDRYRVVPGAVRVPRHPLLEAAIDAFPPPGDRGVEITVACGVPAGCGTGTSAAVAVALVGALAGIRDQPRSPPELAYAAHRLEVEVVGAESGIQDQLSAAFGGINYLEIDSYPHATVRPLQAWEELSTRLTLIFLGRAHDSSAIHRRIIKEAKNTGAPALRRLRAAAEAARDAVVAQDLEAFGRAMIANTEAQILLHPGLVGTDARRVIDAVAADALGWKVNGAGGDGGSLTLLSAGLEAKLELEQRIGALDARYQLLPVQISGAGLEVRGHL